MAKVSSIDGSMSGEPCIDRTRVAVESVVADLRRIYEARPTLPERSVEAAIAWARDKHGPGWWRTDESRRLEDRSAMIGLDGRIPAGSYVNSNSTARPAVWN